MSETIVKPKATARPSFEQQATGMRKSIQADIDVWERSISTNSLQLLLVPKMSARVLKPTSAAKRKVSTAKKK